jgi:hypothetical protein
MNFRLLAIIILLVFGLVYFKTHADNGCDPKECPYPPTKQEPKVAPTPIPTPDQDYDQETDYAYKIG